MFPFQEHLNHKPILQSAVVSHENFTTVISLLLINENIEQQWSQDRETALQVDSLLIEPPTVPENLKLLVREMCFHFTRM